MKVTLNLVFHKLSSIKHIDCQNVDLSRAYDGIKLFDPNYVASDDNNYLFITSVDNFRRYNSLMVGKQILTEWTYLCITNEPEVTLQDFQPDISVVLIHTETRFPSMFNDIIGIFSFYKQWQKTFFENLLEEYSIQELLDRSSEIIDFPLLILDSDFSLLSKNGNETDYDPLFTRIVSEKYLSPEMIPEYQHLQVFQGYHGKRDESIEFTDDKGILCRHIIHYFLVNEKVVASALTIQKDFQQKPYYIYQLDFFMQHLETYFNQKWSKKKKNTTEYEELLLRLISGENISPQRLKDIVKTIPSLKYENDYMLCKIFYPDTNALAPGFACWSIRNTFPQAKVFLYQDSIFMLYSPLDNGQFMEDSQLESLIQIFQGQRLVLGCSNSFYHLSELNIAADQCSTAIELGTLFDKKESNIYYFRDNFLQYLLRELKKTTSFSMIRSFEYEKLSLYDKEHNSNLCDVVMSYIQNGFNINQTSQAIFLHRNTVLKKLKQATDIMNLDLTNYQNVIAYVLSYLNEHITF